MTLSAPDSKFVAIYANFISVMYKAKLGVLTELIKLCNAFYASFTSPVLKAIKRPQGFSLPKEHPTCLCLFGL